MNVSDILLSEVKKYGNSPTVSFFGFGISNKALAEKLRGCGVRLILRSEKPVITDFPFERIYLGENCFDELQEELMIASPSVRRERRELCDIVKRGGITSECELFFSREIGRRYCITGSDGKSSTTRLSLELLGRGENSVFEVGNCGIPYSDVDINDSSLYVAELSSFNLHYLAPECHSALITNVSENHLDWHGSFREYVTDKGSIYKKAERIAVNFDCSYCKELGSEKNVFCLYSAEIDFKELKTQRKAEHYVTLEGGKIKLDGMTVVHTERMKRKARHDVLNMMGAIALTATEVTAADIDEVARNFRGLPHRCEHVAHLSGIDFIDSSIDTSPTRAAVTLRSLDKRVKIILGGKGKGLSLSPLRDPLLKYVEKIGIYGEACQDFTDFIEGDPELCGIEHKALRSFTDCVEYITENAKSGDTVLLCPAATAYGEFGNFAERADKFKELIEYKFKT